MEQTVARRVGSVAWTGDVFQMWLRRSIAGPSVYAMSTNEMALEQRLATELRAEMGRQDRSIRWVAEQIGESHVTVARWVKGRTSPGINALDAMCRSLRMTIADLLQAVERNGGYTPPALPMPRRATQTGPRLVGEGRSECAIRDLNPEPAGMSVPFFQLPYPGQRVVREALVMPLRPVVKPIIVRTDGTPVERAA